MALTGDTCAECPAHDAVGRKAGQSSATVAFHVSAVSPLRPDSARDADIGDLLGSAVAATSMLGGAIAGALPIFPPDNPWNLDISNARVDPASASYPNFRGSAQVYGFPYAVVDSTVRLRTVQFQLCG